MGTALCLLRTSLALWFCLGAQVHLSLDHTAYLEHAVEGHAPSTRGAEPAQTTLHCACGTVEPSHHHQGHYVVHDHEVDAVTVKSSQRTLQLIAAAILPVPPTGIRVQTERATFNLDPVRISPLYLSQESAPRAPPAA